MAKLTETELKVLKECCEEPRTLEGMYESVGLTKEKLQEVLTKLEREGLTYEDEDGNWGSTVKGDKAFYKKEK